MPETKTSKSARSSSKCGWGYRKLAKQFASLVWSDLVRCRQRSNPGTPAKHFLQKDPQSSAVVKKTDFARNRNFSWKKNWNPDKFYFHEMQISHGKLKWEQVQGNWKRRSCKNWRAQGMQTCLRAQTVLWR